MVKKLDDIYLFHGRTKVALFDAKENLSILSDFRCGNGNTTNRTQFLLTYRMPQLARLKSFLNQVEYLTIAAKECIDCASLSARFDYIETKELLYRL